MKELFEEVRAGRPMIFIGKERLTEGVIEHINSVLKKQKIIKIKFQKSVKDQKVMYDIIMELSIKTKSHCLDQRGSVFILSKKLIPAIHQPRKFRKDLFGKSDSEMNSELELNQESEDNSEEELPNTADDE